MVSLLIFPYTEVVGGEGSWKGRRSSRELHGYQRHGTRLVAGLSLVSEIEQILSLLPAAQTMVDLSRGKANVDDFAVAIDNNLGEFEFPDDFVIELWTAIELARSLQTSS